MTTSITAQFGNVACLGSITAQVKMIGDYPSGNGMMDSIPAVFSNTSLGKSGSSATYSGNAYMTLYSYLWNCDTCTISGGKGADAETDWGNNKKLVIDNSFSVYDSPAFEITGVFKIPAMTYWMALGNSYSVDGTQQLPW